MARKPKRAGDGKRPPGKPKGGNPKVEDVGLLERHDPDLAWATATNYSYLGGWTNQVLLFIELREGTTIQEFRKLALERFADRIQVSPLYATPPVGLEKATFCAATVTDARKFFQKIGNEELHDLIVRFELGLPGLNVPSALPARAGRPPIEPVVTAVMDDALAFAHQRFRRGNGAARVEYLWNQGPSGPVLSGDNIDAALTNCTHAGLLDEDQVYRTLRHEDFLASGHKPLSRRRAHGTHVMDLACGEDPGSTHENRPIVGVQFPNEVIRDTSGAWLGPHMGAGLWFILLAADAIASNHGIAGPLPVAVNVSYGKFAGPHDGKSMLEGAMDEFVRLRRLAGAPLAVVLPSGNSYLARCHARFTLASGQNREIDWRVLPDDQTPSVLQIWPGPVDGSGKAPGLEVTLIPPVASPQAGMVLTVKRGEIAQWPPSVPARWSIQYAVPGPGAKVHRDAVQATLGATSTLDLSQPVALAPAGIWKIDVKNTANVPVVIEAWIERDDTPYGWPITGRQSRFEDGKYVRFNPRGQYLRGNAGRESEGVDAAGVVVTRDRSVNAIATGQETVVIGGFRVSDYRASWYSAGGPLVPVPARVGPDPDAMAVGDDSIACHGVLAAGTRGTNRTSMSGTSVAAPQITRWIADQMFASSGADRSAVQGLAAGLDTPSAPPVPVDRKGAGRVDVRVARRVPRK